MDFQKNKIRKVLGTKYSPKEIERIEKILEKGSEKSGIDYFTFSREVAFNLIKQPEKQDEILAEASDGVYGLESIVNEEFKQKKRKCLDRLITPEEAKAGKFNCKSCGSNKCIFIPKQILAGDESETIFLRCTKCGTRWKI